MPKTSGYVRKNAEFRRLEKKGDSAEGFLIGVTVIEFEPKAAGQLPGHAPKLTFQALTGNARFSVLGGSTILDDAAALELGVKTKIVFNGKVKTSKGFNAGSWELFQDCEVKIDA